MLAGIALSLLLLDLTARLLAIWVALPFFEGSPPLTGRHDAPDESAVNLSCSTVDGQTIRMAMFQPSDAGRLSQRPKAVIVFCPELNSDRWSAPAYLSSLLAEGFCVVGFDFRSQGESDPVPGYRPTHWLTQYEVDDVLAVVREVQSRPGLKGLAVLLYGVSRGGSAAIAAAARLPGVIAVATDGAFTPGNMMLHFFYRWARLYVPEWLPRLLPRWHIEITLWMLQQVSAWRRKVRYVHLEPALRRLRERPVLMISGERDNYVLPKFTRELHELTGQSDDRLWIVPSAKHNGSRLIDPEAYDLRLRMFFLEALYGGANVPAPHFDPDTRRVSQPALVPDVSGSPS